MKKITVGLSLFLLSLGYSTPSIAATKTQAKSASQQSIDKKTRDALKQEFSEKLNIKIISVDIAPMYGYYQLTSSQGILYVSHDKKYMMLGNVYALEGGITNLTEKSQQSYRVQQIEQYKNKMIVFSAKKEKHVITVFTDVSCGYCQKLHKEINTYNDQGITVRYLAFPRGGKSSKAFTTMTKVWCSADQKNAMNLAQNGQNIKASVLSKSCDNDILQQYELGNMFGINGTPAIILEDGEMLPGYVPAQKLTQKLATPKP